MTSKLHVLITRPKAQGLQLQQALASANISSICQPLFTYQLTNKQAKISPQLDLQQHTIAIFISQAAVEFANQLQPLNQWVHQCKTVIAVGKKTQQCLATFGVEALTPKSENSEGMLAIAALEKSQVDKQLVLIFRGDSGRELLATELEHRGATVQYIECYQRQWLELELDQDKLWKNQLINAIVVTSNAILQRICTVVDVNEAYWQSECYWLVASERIANTARQLGLNNIINCHGANDQAVSQALQQLELKHDR